VLSVRFHPEAVLELKDGAGFYGDRFVDHIHDALALISELPNTWPAWRGHASLRRRVVKKFPYAIIYAVERRGIFVMAIEHTKRRPGYWLTRL
jgi:plasmid stabilization system protein ParE